MNATAASDGQPQPAPPVATPDQPVSSGERIVTLDFIRGIAVLAILFPNVVAHAYPMLAYYWPEGLAGGSTAFDRAVWLFQFVLIDGKFRGLFTLLFGAGIYLFMERAWARGSTRGLQVRRLVWLALFGVVHYYLIWFGDILFGYAMSGLMVLPMLGWQARTQLRVGLAWYIGGSLALAAALGGQAAVEGLPRAQTEQPAAYAQLLDSKAGLLRDAEETTAVMRDGSYGDVVGHRLANQSLGLIKAPIFALFETVPLMLLGMALYRLGLFEGGLDRRKLRRWGWIGLVGGALLTLPLGLWAMAAAFPLMLTQFVFNGAPALFHLAMVFGLAALLSLWAPRAAATWLGSRFVAAGRTAFSNYIGSSLVMMLVFQGWAGGLYGELHRGALLAIVLATWVLMLAWSKPWLSRYRYGPLEWLWRCLTYRKRFALRRSPQTFA